MTNGEDGPVIARTKTRDGILKKRRRGGIKKRRRRGEGDKKLVATNRLSMCFEGSMEVLLAAL